MAEAILLTSFNCKDCSKKSVSIINRATAPHLSILYYWIARVSCPPITKWLLIHMPVEKDAVCACWISWLHIYYQERAPSFILDWCDSCAFNVLSLCKGLQMIALLIEVAIFLPFRIIKGRQTWNSYKL